MVTSTNSRNLSVIHAQRTEQLVDALAEALSPVSPFSRQTVLVPNSGMQRYLQLALTEKTQLLAHIDITYLGTHLWQSQNGSAHAFSLPDVRAVTFAIDALLSESLTHKTSFPPRLEKHVAHIKTAQQRFAWAKALALMILRYATHRQHWLKRWQADETVSQHPDEAWQKFLVRTLLPLFPSLIRDENATSDSNDSLHIFGFHAIPETHRHALWQLSQPLYFYCLNPSSEYWGQLSTETQALQASINHPEDALHHDIGNPLLAHWGNAGKHLLATLLDDATWYECAPSETPANRSLLDAETNLTKLQASIDALTANIATGNADDDSISIHACANARREVDVVFDWICQELDDDSTLSLSDFLVMTPNIGDYASHIHAVFGQSSLQYYSVANQTEASAQEDVRAFLAVLSVIASRFSVATFFDFCAQPAIMRAFAIDTQDLSTIRHWLISANVNWGVTPAQKAEYAQDRSITHQGSLEKLIDELNLAHVFGEIHLPAINPDYRATQFDTLQKLNRLHAICADFANVGDLVQSLNAWYQTLITLIEQCHLSESEPLTAAMKDWHDAIKDSGEVERNEYTFEIIYTDICDMFDGRELHGPFLSGGITFCAMQPMRAIPARRMCMLGMNQAFPQPEVFVDYDLRKSLPEAYDVLRHDEQKYFMLETILSAREKLYFSYQGIDEKDAKQLPPSPLVNEIINFFKQSGITLPHHTHALQRFHREENWRQFSQHRAHHPKEQIPQRESVQTEKEHQDYETNTQVFSVDELAMYLVAPLQAYLDANKVRMSTPHKDLSDFEMLLPDGLDKYHIDKSFITDATTAERWLYQQNRVPATALKSETFARQQESLNEFRATHERVLETLAPQADTTTTHVYLDNLSVQNISVHYDLSPLYGDTRYLWDVSKLKLKTLVHVFLTQLCAAANATPIQSIVLSKSDKKYPYHLTLHTAADSHHAREMLTTIVHLLQQCQATPTPVQFSIVRNKQVKLSTDELSNLELSLIPKDFQQRENTEVPMQIAIEQCLTEILSAFSYV